MRTLTLLQPQRLVFGRGCTADAVAYLAALRPAHLHVLTSTSLAQIAAGIADELGNAGIDVSIDAAISREPTVTDFEAALARARQVRASCILGLGGGSVLDLAKIVAALTLADQELEETFGVGLLQGHSCHLVCMPATAGTGSEVSPNAILLDEERRLKRAVISPFLVPDATFIDPELMRTMPPALTASTGLDALAHCIEAYTNKFAHRMVDLYAREGIRLCGQWLLRAVRDGHDMEAREGMALASLYGGLCLGPVNTAAAHALAYPLGSEYGIPHGLSVALVLPHVFRFNARADPARHAEVARALRVLDGPSPLETAQNAADEIQTLVHACGLDSNLASYGITAQSVPGLAQAAMRVTRLLQNNPRPLSEADCVQIFTGCIQ